MVAGYRRLLNQIQMSHFTKHKRFHVVHFMRKDTYFVKRNKRPVNLCHGVAHIYILVTALQFMRS